MNYRPTKCDPAVSVSRIASQVRESLKSMVLRRLKVGFVPAKADVDVQERFKNEKLEPRLAEAQGGRRVVFFVDAAHFVLAPFLGYL